MFASMLLSLSLLAAPARAAEWPDLGAAPTGAARDGANDVALVITIGNYVFDSVPDIPGATENGEAWRRYLKEVRGVGVVKLLADQEATREDMLVAARTLRARVKPGGRFWVVFVGHGAPSEDGKDGLLVGADAKGEATSLYARSLPQAELLRAAGAEEGVNVVAFVDACFSGGATGAVERRALAQGLQPLIPTALAEVARQRSATVLTAARGDQFAGPLPGLGRPAFSWLALGALRGWGDADGDGQVSARELTDYVADRMAEVVKGRLQEPQLIGGEALVLGKGRESAPDLEALTRLPGSPVSGAPASASSPAATGTSFGSATLDVSAQLKEQACVDEARTKLSTQREQELAKAAARVQSEGRLALGALKPQAEACTKLADKAERQPCQQALDTWLTSARGAHAELAATSQSVPTACGPRNAADPARRVGVDLRAEIAAAGELRGKVEVGPPTKMAAAGAPPKPVASAPKASPAGGGASLRSSNDVGKLGYAMVRIEPGTFTMGSPDSEPGRDSDEAEHTVVLTKAFMLGKTEVTQELWAAVMGNNPSRLLDCGRSCPVEYVSWCDAVTFANRMSEAEGLDAAYEVSKDCVEVSWRRNANGYRLPTEAEWEYAARSGTRAPAWSALDEVAWNKSNSRRTTHDVAILVPNAWGMYDTLGNVWEWVWDWYGEYSGMATDPSGPDLGTRRVRRGGSWRDDSAWARLAFRNKDEPGVKASAVGLRLARSLP